MSFGWTNAGYGALVGGVPGALIGGFLGGKKKKKRYKDPAADSRTSWRKLAPPPQFNAGPGAGVGPQMEGGPAAMPTPSFGRPPFQPGAFAPPPFAPPSMMPGGAPMVGRAPMMGAGIPMRPRVGFTPPPMGPGMPGASSPALRAQRGG